MRMPKVVFLIILTKEQKRRMKKFFTLLLIVFFITANPTVAHANPIAPAMTGGAATGAAILSFTPAAPVILIGAVVVATGAAVYYLVEESNQDQVTNEDKEKEKEKAKDLGEEIIKNGGKPLPGYKGGQTFENREGKLPKDVEYKEYDVNIKTPGKARDSKRLVIGSDGSIWYTNDHYRSFEKLN